MDQGAKMSKAAELAADELAGVALSGQPEVDGNTVIWKMTEQYMTEQGGTSTREAIAGGWDLATGEWIERMTYDVLQSNWEGGEIEVGERVFFDGELMTMTMLSDGPLHDVMNVVMPNGEHLGPAEVRALMDSEGNVRVVEYQYTPNNPTTEIMSVVRAEANNGQTMIVLQPLSTEGVFVFDGQDPVTKSEISNWFTYLKKYGGNRVLNNAIDTAGSTFVLVTADPSNYPGGWAGVRGDVARFTGDGSPSFTADQRGEDGKNVILFTRLALPELLKDGGFRYIVNWGDGSDIGTFLMGSLTRGAQNPATVNNLALGYTEYAATGYFELPHKHGLKWKVFK